MPGLWVDLDPRVFKAIEPWRRRRGGSFGARCGSMRSHVRLSPGSILGVVPGPKAA